MGIDRRDFMKTIGLAGATLVVGKSLAAPPKEEVATEFYGMLFDSVACLGCQRCEKICAEQNNLPAPKEKTVAGVIRKMDEKQRTVLNTYNTSKGEVYKTKEGPVIWRGDKCMGCRYCMVSCPFDVPKFEYHSANPKIEKCTMCYERIKQGKIPACAENCSGDALLFGTRRELIAEARKRIAENPKDYVDTIYGEHEAGGTSFLYLSSAPFNEVGFSTTLQKESYPGLSKGFLYSVPSVFVLWPAILLGIHEATKNNHPKEEENE